MKNTHQTKPYLKKQALTQARKLLLKQQTRPATLLMVPTEIAGLVYLIPNLTILALRNTPFFTGSYPFCKAVVYHLFFHIRSARINIYYKSYITKVHPLVSCGKIRRLFLGGLYKIDII